MASFNFPFNITKNTPAIAGQVQTNFNDLLTWIMSNLIQKDGTVAMTGPLVLAPGEPASPDHAANKAYVDALMPVGIIWEYSGTTLPTNWLWADGATYSNTSQPLLANAIGRNFTDAAVPAGSFQVPDKRRRVSVGADSTEAAVFGLGKKGGQRDTEVMTHTHPIPAHGHGMTGGVTNGDAPDHLHYPGTLRAGEAGAHSHNISASLGLFRFQGSGGGYGSPGAGNSFGATGAWIDAPDHAHAVNSGTTGGADRVLTHGHANTFVVTNAPAFATDTAGAGSTLTDKNLPPYIAVNYIIYAGG